MIFEQFYLGCLAHASYLIGSEGVAAVIDPQRDVGIYVEAAQRLGLRIAHVIETHLHADFVSGHRELAELTGAAIYLGEGSGAEFPHRAVRDGDLVELGRCRLRFLQTPGHTAESVSVVVTDLEAGTEPAAVLTGDTLFIGDVGRPDLSDRFTPQELAGQLYDSLHEKLMVLPDGVKVYPAHGAGSMCGRNISADRSSTIGRERESNYALKPMAKARFVEMMTQDLPARPEYFQQDVDVNRHGAPALGKLSPLTSLTPQEVRLRQTAGATVLDTRAATPYCSGHVPGSLQIGLGGQFAAWAGALVGLERDVILVADDDKAADEARLRLARVGIDRVAGVLQGGIAAWAGAGLPLEQTGQMSVRELHEEMLTDPALVVLDVRRAAEWDQGHVEGAHHCPLDQLRDGMKGLDPEKLTAVHCQGGYRSMIACSVLQGGGFERVVNVMGGWDAWTGMRRDGGRR